VLTLHAKNEILEANVTVAFMQTCIRKGGVVAQLSAARSGQQQEARGGVSLASLSAETPALTQGASLVQQRQALHGLLDTDLLIALLSGLTGPNVRPVPSL
jgi:hypothetical protein